MTFLHLIAGDLFADEIVIGLIFVKRAHHIIAIAPGIGPIEVMLEALRIGIARNVEPVPSPALP